MNMPAVIIRYRIPPFMLMANAAGNGPFRHREFGMTTDFFISEAAKSSPSVVICLGGSAKMDLEDTGFLQVGFVFILIRAPTP